MEKIKTCFIVCIILITYSCAPDPHQGPFLLGTLNLSNYVAIGSEYTAGYANDGLYPEAQHNSFPYILINQIQQTQQGGNIPFNIPYLAEGKDLHHFIQRFSIDDCSEFSYSFELGNSEYTSSVNWYDLDKSDVYNNMGIPHLKVLDIENQTTSTPEGFLNVYFDRMQPDSGNKITYLQYIDTLKPTFFTSELGFNDLWWYAWYGGSVPGISDLTKPADFEAKYRKLLQKLIEKHNAKGVLFTIPYVEDLPFVTYIGHQYKDRETCETLSIYVEDPQNGSKKLTLGEYVTLKGLSQLQNGFGFDPVNSYLKDSLVLTGDEILTLNQYTDAYNHIIRELASEYDLALMDMNLLCQEVSNNYLMIDGLMVTNEYLIGGFYSSDGWTCTPRGNAIIAYRTIEAINKKYDTSIPLPNIHAYEDMKFPR